MGSRQPAAAPPPHRLAEHQDAGSQYQHIEQRCAGDRLWPRFCRKQASDWPGWSANNFAPKLGLPVER
jgi:hypothetical protein